MAEQLPLVLFSPNHLRTSCIIKGIMKTQMIQIDAFDSLKSLVEKVIQARTSRVLILDQGDNQIPRDEVLTKVFLRRCLQAGKQIGFVTKDPETKAIWSACEVSVFSDIVSAEQDIWQTIGFTNQLNRDSSPRTQILSELKTNKPKPKHPLNQTWRVIIFSVAILSVLGMLAFLIPSSRIIITVPREEVLVEYPVQISPEINQLNISGQIPGKKFEFPFQMIQSIPVTGTTQIADEYSKGTVTFLGNLSNQSLPIPAGTIVSTSSDQSIEFKTLTDCELGASNKAECTAEVAAIVPGSNGNIAAGQIDTIEGEFGDAVRVTNLEPFLGGQVNENSSPSEDDRIKLQEKITKVIEQQGIEKAHASLGSQFWIVPGSFQIIKSGTEKYYPPIGSAGDSLTLESEGTAAILVVDQSQLIEYIEQVSLSGPTSTNRILSGSVVITGLSQNRQSSANYGQVILIANTTRIPQFDSSSIAFQIAGKPKSQVREHILKLMPSSRSVDIKGFPSWWPWVAALPMQVQVELR